MLRFSHNFGFGNKNFNYKTFCRAIYRKYNKGKMGYTNECYNHNNIIVFPSIFHK